MKKTIILICTLLLTAAFHANAQTLFVHTPTAVDSTMMRLQQRFDPFHLYVAKTDDLPQRSIMFSGMRMPSHIDTSPFRCGPYWVPDPPSLFMDDDIYYNSDNTLGGALLETLLNILLIH